MTVGGEAEDWADGGSSPPPFFPTAHLTVRIDAMLPPSSNPRPRICHSACVAEYVAIFALIAKQNVQERYRLEVDMNHREKKRNEPNSFDFQQLATCIKAISRNMQLFDNVDDRHHACQTISVQIRKLLLDKSPLVPRCYGKKFLKFHPIIDVPLASEPFHESSIGCLGGGYLEFQLVNQDGNTKPGSIPERVAFAPSSTFVQVYPLPGVSHDANKNRVIVSNPFDLNALPSMNIDQWLSQKMVSICGHDMTLRDILKTTANEEGAHARNFGTDRESTIYISRQFMFGGFSYFHWMVLLTANYLIGRIAKFKLHRDRLIRAGIDFRRIEQIQIRDISMSADAVKYQESIEIPIHLGENQPERRYYYSMKPCEDA